jgi:hypothetical protein
MSYAKTLSFESEIGEFVLEETQKLGLAIDKDLVIQTPIDTSNAASKWVVTVGTQKNTQEPEGIPGVGAAIAQGQSAISTAKEYQDIYIQNLEPYIGLLNAGLSDKADPGYVDTIIRKRAAE